MFELSGLFPPLSVFETLLAKNSQKSTQLLSIFTAVFEVIFRNLSTFLYITVIFVFV